MRKRKVEKRQANKANAYELIYAAKGTEGKEIEIHKTAIGALDWKRRLADTPTSTQVIERNVYKQNAAYTSIVFVADRNEFSNRK